MQPTVKLSTFCRNTEERKLWQRSQFKFQLPSAWSDVSVLQEAKPFYTPADQKPEDNVFTLQNKLEAKPQAVVLRRETNRLRDEAFVSINLSLPQDTHKNILLKATLDTGAWATHSQWGFAVKCASRT